MYNPFTLEGKTILVTGASSGIGKATAIECSKMGAKVIVCGRNEERLKDTLSLLEKNEHSSFVGDLTEEGKLGELVSSLPEIDGAFFSAGLGILLPLSFSTRKKFDRVFDVNFFSQVELFRLLTKQKRLKKNSSVVIIVSIGGVNVFENGSTIYGTTKAALNSFVSYAAKEYAPKKIRVNAICPGMVDTPLIHSDAFSDEQVVADIESYPLKRYGSPFDVAMGAVYLLSDASSWVTGHSLIIDGGKSIG